MKRRALHEMYWKLQSLIAPGLKYSQTIYEEVISEHCAGVATWLDLGCGHHLLPAWRREQEKQLVREAKFVVGVDYDYLSLTKHKTIQHRVRGDVTRLPFPDNTFDLITSNMVFEHLEHPEIQLKEIARVLTPNGKLIFHTPSSLGYSTLMARMIPEGMKDKLVYLLEGRKAEDVFPTYYRTNSPSKIKQLANLSGLDVVKIKMICSAAQVVVVPPIAFFELLWIRFLLSEAGKPLRTNIIAILSKA